MEFDRDLVMSALRQHSSLVLLIVANISMFFCVSEEGLRIALQSYGQSSKPARVLRILTEF